MEFRALIGVSNTCGISQLTNFLFTFTMISAHIKALSSGFINDMVSLLVEYMGCTDFFSSKNQFELKINQIKNLLKECCTRVFSEIQTCRKVNKSK